MDNLPIATPEVVKPAPPKPPRAPITWFQALDAVRPYVFKISTPAGSGTGFQITYTKNSKLCGIATAYHVISHEHHWGLPIEVTHFDSKVSLILQEKNRAIFIHPKEDLAFILFSTEKFTLKTESLNLTGPKQTLKAGVQVGWCGFPSVAREDLCFFNGYISTYQKSRDVYLVDGVVIHGVSGGPAFWISQPANEIRLCGVVTAYMPNRAVGTTLPGLSMLASVEPYQKELQNLKTVDDAYKAADKKPSEEFVIPGNLMTPPPPQPPPTTAPAVTQ